MAQLKNTTISDTGFLQLPVGTTAQRPSPAAGQMRFNSITGKAEFYNSSVGAWIGTAAAGVVATGGNSVYDVDVEGTTYRVHVFTNTGNSTFTVTQGGSVEYLIVAGGGGGGYNHGGGGGAGGLLTGFTTVTSHSYTITVGAGGNVTGLSEDNGDSSSAFGLTAIGGGAGSNWSGNGFAGGSGGGGSAGRPGGAGTPGQGNNGGSGGATSNPYPAGGGGGAGSIGGDGAGIRGGDGGQGIASSITGINTFYAGGGGGGHRATQNSGVGEPGQGGIGGGGDGGDINVLGGKGINGTPNTGGGGGGAEDNTGTGNEPGGNGGSGIVIVRYPLRQENPVSAAGKVVGDGLVLDLDFAKPTVYAGTGTVVNDSRLNGVTGTLVNSPVFGDARTQRSSFSFNGTNQYIITNFGPRLTTGDSFSVNVWFRTTVSQSGRLTEARDANKDGNPLIVLTLATNRIDFITRGQNGVRRDAVSSPITYTNGSWIMVTGNILSNGTVQIYINGQLSGQNTSGVDTRIDLRDTPLAIAARNLEGNISAFFNGSIASVSYYTKSLTATEVSQNFNATRWRFGV